MDLNGKLIGVEQDYFGQSSPSLHTYKRFRHVWIKERKSLPVLYRSIKNLPGIDPLPCLRIKKWLRWSYETVLWKKKKTYTLLRLLGPVLGWYMIRDKMAYQTDATLIIEQSSTVLIYNEPDKKCVIKMALNKNTKMPTEQLKRSLHNELNILQSIHYPLDQVKIPKLIKDGSRFAYPYIVQKLIYGNTLYYTRSKRFKPQVVYVFRLLKQLYTEQKIKLKYPFFKQDSKEFLFFIFYLNEYYLNRDTIKTFSIETLRKVYFNKKKLLVSHIHGDLMSGNIILDKKGCLWLIDWGGTKEYYIVRDLDDSFSKDAKVVYNELLDEMKYSRADIYTYHEQVFISKIERIITGLAAYNNKANLRKVPVNYFNRKIAEAFDYAQKLKHL